MKQGSDTDHTESTNWGRSYYSERYDGWQAAFDQNMAGALEPVSVSQDPFTEHISAIEARFTHISKTITKVKHSGGIQVPARHASDSHPDQAYIGQQAILRFIMANGFEDNYYAGPLEEWQDFIDDKPVDVTRTVLFQIERFYIYIYGEETNSWWRESLVAERLRPGCVSLTQKRPFVLTLPPDEAWE